MDFSDFSEFIGPLIFGIIAWLSSYFSKKKKPKQSSPDSLKNKSDLKSKFEQIIQESFNPVMVGEKSLEEVEIIENNEVNKIFSVVGGGDTVSLLNNINVVDCFDFVSTAGGAFLEYLEGKKLPGITALN